MGAACSNQAADVTTPAQSAGIVQHEENGVGGNRACIASGAASIRPQNGGNESPLEHAKSEGNPTEVDLSELYSEPPKDQQIKDWLVSVEEIPPEVLADALRCPIRISSIIML